MITMEERTKQFIELTERMINLQFKKGNDYAEHTDGLANLRRKGELGIWNRMDDKMFRLKNLIESKKTPLVEDESIEDTLIDLANYSLLLIILRRDNANR